MKKGGEFPGKREIGREGDTTAQRGEGDGKGRLERRIGGGSEGDARRQDLEGERGREEDMMKARGKGGWEGGRERGKEGGRKTGRE